MSLILHYAPDNASLIVRLALEELGLAYAARLVDRAARAQDGAAYRALNPAGLIPALETPDGPIFETGAILLWLADRHGALAPAQDDPRRGAFLKWLFFTANTLHPALRMTFYPEKYAGPDPRAQAALRDTVQTALRTHLSLLDSAFATEPALADAPHILDCYLGPCLRWCALYPRGHTDWFDLSAYPALVARMAAFETRPSVAAAMTAEGLGPTPFTAPRLATPPEGSAT